MAERRGPGPAGRAPRRPASTGRAERLKRQGALLLICGAALQIGVFAVDTAFAEQLGAAGLRDLVYFAGTGIGLLLFCAAGVRVWQSFRQVGG